MLELPTVTLCVMEQNFDTAVDLARAMRRIVQFGAVRISDHVDYESFIHEEFHMHERVPTAHLLTVHTDGYILNPALWNPDWLNYDYIGAPWPENYLLGSNPNWTYRVGNGGFCLRSVRLSKFISGLWNEKPFDLTVCQQFRPGLELSGFTFAPADEAAKFSIEHWCPETPERSFGFHTPKGTNKKE